jgi:hypothetical protein
MEIKVKLRLWILASTLNKAAWSINHPHKVVPPPGRDLNLIETYCCPLSTVIGNRAGPGTVAQTYMAGVP